METRWNFFFHSCSKEDDIYHCISLLYIQNFISRILHVIQRNFLVRGSYILLAYTKTSEVLLGFYSGAARAWNNVRRGTWGFPTSVKAGKVAMLTLTVSERLKNQEKDKDQKFVKQSLGNTRLFLEVWRKRPNYNR